MICNAGIKDKILSEPEGICNSLQLKPVAFKQKSPFSSTSTVSDFAPSDENKPFAFPMGVSPIDSYTPAVQMGFSLCPASAKCIQNPHDGRFRCHALLHYVTLSHVLSPHTMSAHKAAVS